MFQRSPGPTVLPSGPCAKTPTLGEDGGLSGELLQHLGGPGQPVSTLPDADVQAQLADAEFLHGILLLLTLVLEKKHKVNQAIKKSLSSLQHSSLSISVLLKLTQYLVSCC